MAGLSFSKLSLKVASAYMFPQSSDISLQKVVNAKQKHLGCTKVQGQSEAACKQTGATKSLGFDIS